MAIKKSVKKRIVKIIKDKYLTDWEFILHEIGSQFESHELDLGSEDAVEVSEMLREEIELRHDKLWSDFKETTVCKK